MRTTFREWDRIPRIIFSELRELLREYPGTLPELREWPFHSESVFPEIGVVSRFDDDDDDDMMMMVMMMVMMMMMMTCANLGPHKSSLKNWCEQDRETDRKKHKQRAV